MSLMRGLAQAGVAATGAPIAATEATASNA
jgi:hypothetical protein